MTANNSLAARLQQARRRRFIGREAEKELFRSALHADTLPFHILFVHGPGGVGKTALLDEFARLSRQADVPVYRVDGRDVEPTPQSFLRALRKAAGAEPDTPPAEAFPREATHTVIFIDNYERLGALDRWLRNTLIPQLPGNTLLAIAGRQPPAPDWRSDPGWQALVRVVPLRNLSPVESREFLTERNIPAGQHDAVLSFTHGYPLALSLVADTFAQRPEMEFKPEQAPDVIKTLLDRLVETVPSPAHRAALEACALVRLTTEPLLAHMAAVADGRELFAWLRQLSFIKAGPAGVYPHRLAREVLAAELRWRNPDWYSELHDRARAYYSARLQETRGQEQQATLVNYVYLHRHNPVVQPFFAQIQAQGQGVSGLLTDVAREGDWPALLAMVAAHEGEEAARLAEHWFERQPESVTVFRDEGDAPAGFMTTLALHDASAEDRDADPATKVAWQYLHDNAPLRPGEKATYFRFWMAADTYQDPSTVQGLIGVNAIRHYLMEPGLAYSFFPTANPQFWTALLTYADLHLLPDVAFTVGGQEYGVFVHDWRAVPPATWLEMLAEQELATSSQTASEPKAVEPLLVLSRPEFTDAVREALQDYTRPDLLVDNPLLQSRLVVDAAGSDADAGDKAETLRDLIGDAAGTLESGSRGRKFHRALYHTYLQPAPTQAKAAEILDLPMGTFRRHLKSGIDEVTEMLWQREIGAMEP